MPRFRGYTPIVSPGSILESLSPYARAATAIAPLFIALAIRLVLGKGRLTGALLTAATVWFAANLLMAPFSSRMQQDIETVRALFR
jgi:hypothetical protein